MSAEAKTWRERIVEARTRGEFLNVDRRDAHVWLTCAVGEQHAQMPSVVVYTPALRLDGGLQPRDKKLRRLGGDRGFYDAVLNDEFDKAEKWLDRIEDRALELKRASGASRPEGARP